MKCVEEQRSITRFMPQIKMTAEQPAVIFIAEDRELNLLLNLSRLSNSVTKIVEFSATNLSLAEYYDLVNVGGMKGEGLLNAYAVGNSSYGEGLRDSAAVLSDNGTLEELNSLLLTLDDTNVNLYAVADAELVNIGLKLLVYKSLDLFHFGLLLKSTNIRAELLQRTVLNTPVTYAQIW